MHDRVGPAPMDSVIDLDVADERLGQWVAVPWRRWRRVASKRLPVAGVVALVLSGVVVGGVAGQRWEVAQQRARHASELSLFLAVAGLNSAAGADGRVTIEGSIAVVNGGPMPVEVTGAGRVADVMVWGQHRIASAASAWFAVSATVTCTDEAGSRPLPVDFSVVTADGVRRIATAGLQLMGSSWHEVVLRACALPG